MKHVNTGRAAGMRIIAIIRSARIFPLSFLFALVDIFVRSCCFFSLLLVL